MRRANNDQQVLTKGEMEIMKHLWQSDHALSTKDILEASDEPKPAYTTIATFLKILSAKGFVTEQKMPNRGKTLFYKPLVSQDEYTSRVMDEVTTNFFSGSVPSLVNFFMRRDKISRQEVEQLLSMVEASQQETADN